MKVLIVTYGLNTIGGVQNWQHLFSHELLKRGHDITILEMYDYSISRPEQKFERNWDSDIKIIHHNGPVLQRGINPLTSLAAIQVITNFVDKVRFHKLIKKEKYKVILFVDPNFTFYLFKKTLRANNCIVQFHSSFNRFRATSRLRYIATKYLHQYYKKFIFLSKGDMLHAKQQGFVMQNLGYMYNFIDDRKFVEYGEHRIPRIKQILIVGNLDNPDKQVDHVLRAYSMIDEEIRKEWIIKIIGEGKYKNKLKELSIQLGIIEKVYLVGKISNPVKDFCESSLYVLSSSFEGAPLTILECIFANLPIVAYKCSPFIEEVVVDGITGFVVEPNNVEQLALAMKKMIVNPALLDSMSQNLIKESSKYSLELSINKWEALFGNVTNYEFNC